MEVIWCDAMYYNNKEYIYSSSGVVLGKKRVVKRRVGESITSSKCSGAYADVVAAPGARSPKNQPTLETQRK